VSSEKPKADIRHQITVELVDPESVGERPAPAWRDAEAAIAVAEWLYLADGCTNNSSLAHDQVRDLVKTAAASFVATGRTREAFKLLAAIRLPPNLIDSELFRLRSVVSLYEQRRVARVRQCLYHGLLAVVVYVFLIAPTIFVALENPHRVANKMEPLDWSEGLYWSVITSMTVGYGDIIPQTPYARLLSLFAATLGVMMMGVVGGLILGHVTPRQLD
jgi:hypothetical protein